MPILKILLIAAAAIAGVSLVLVALCCGAFLLMLFLGSGMGKLWPLHESQTAPPPGAAICQDCKQVADLVRQQSTQGPGFTMYCDSYCCPHCDHEYDVTY